MRTFNKRNIILFISVITFIILVNLTPYAVLYAVIYRLNHGNPYEIKIVNKHIPPYLEKRGYTDKDIIVQHPAEPKGSSNKDYYHTQYMVKFKDEPDITYYYGVRKKGKGVKQFCERYSPNPKYREIVKPTRHSEDDCVNYYDNQ